MKRAREGTVKAISAPNFSEVTASRNLMKGRERESERARVNGSCWNTAYEHVMGESVVSSS